MSFIEGASQSRRQVSVVNSGGHLHEGEHVSSVHQPVRAADEHPQLLATTQLRVALQRNTPIRPEAVQRGKELFSNVLYPSEELIDGVSRLLAQGLKD